MCVRIKICGITDVDAVRAVSAVGVDAVGLVFADSPRRVTLAQAHALCQHLAKGIRRVAVLRHASFGEVNRIVQGFAPDVVQCEPNDDIDETILDHCRFLPVFHDNEQLLAEVAIWRDKRKFDGTILLEARGRGGRGVQPDWERAAKLAQDGPLALAGGLTAGNVAAAIDTVMPAWVDASSSLEIRPGHKSPARIIEFITEVRRAGAALQRKTA